MALRNGIGSHPGKSNRRDGGKLFERLPQRIADIDDLAGKLSAKLPCDFAEDLFRPSAWLRLVKVLFQLWDYLER